MDITALALFAADTTKTTPGVPGIGALLAWWICDRNKRNPIGGWLQYFYWTLYGGFLFSLVLLWMNSTSYIPEYSGDSKAYSLFLASVVPGLVLLFIQVIVGTFLLTVRTAEMLRLFRWIMGLSVAASIIGIVLDNFYNPDNIAFGVIALISDFCWWIYFIRSVRVKHVFQFDDWDIAVQSIYPPKQGAALS